MHKTGGTYIRLIPPEEGGEALSLDELREYLDARKITYNTGDLRDALEGHTSERIVRLSGESVRPCGESFSLKISSDKMTVTARFYAPSKGGENLTAANLIEELKAKKIQHGICRKILKIFLHTNLIAGMWPWRRGLPVRRASRAGLNICSRQTGRQNRRSERTAAWTFIN